MNKEASPREATALYFNTLRSLAASEVRHLKYCLTLKVVTSIAEKKGLAPTKNQKALLIPTNPRLQNIQRFNNQYSKGNVPEANLEHDNLDKTTSPVSAPAHLIELQLFKESSKISILRKRDLTKRARIMAISEISKSIFS